MGTERLDVLNEYLKLTALIYMSWHRGWKYKKQEKQARKLLDELRRTRSFRTMQIERNLIWALEAPEGVSKSDYFRDKP
jgi:hypothetical protein